QGRKYAAALGDEAHPALDGAEGGPAGDVRALEAHGAATGRREADDRPDERGLADAIAPENADHLAGPDGERHALEHVALAVVRLQVRDVKHRGRSRAPAGWP